MALGFLFRGWSWYDMLLAGLALAYIGGFVAAIEYALARLHFMSSF